ncbi:hypothetical protein [Parasedimentitalea psychrophila]|uniref:Polyketide synthase n=1 Tax=Parasedimentitalea psychrophila TaxID=2997337 RepID=A0A9Y2P5H8_9RHOB|nr:hypothetical protein [Parasedimentitalea psychrophila]WIY26384.1 hypothetical protein QPJ95_05575 [Parasedimentitalea psychrophila]
MAAWQRHKTGLALIAALCFAVLSGLHAARPVSAEVVFSAYGYAAGDICGFGQEAGQPDCPNCTLATGLVVLGHVDFLVWQAVSTGRLLLLRSDIANCGGAIDPHQARGPPLFT